MKKLATCFLLLLSITAHAATGPAPVVASFSILGDMVQEIGGDAVSVTTLVGPNSDTHTYQPTPEDAKNIAAAKLVFVNGLGFEGWMDRLIAASGYKGPIVIASAGVTSHQMSDDSKTVTDPHAWQSLANAHVYVKNIAAALEAALPDAANDIANRATKYDAAISAKDTWVKAELSAVPARQRQVITSHDAFGYFAREYDVKILAPQGYSTESEPNAADVAKLIDQMKATGIKTVFLENMTNTRMITQLGRDAGAKVGGTLYSDALSAPGETAPTYLKMFDNNVPKMKAAMLEIQK
jgi:zinc/manganese transport system substrate-binding protein